MGQGLRSTMKAPIVQLELVFYGKILPVHLLDDDFILSRMWPSDQALAHTDLLVPKSKARTASYSMMSKRVDSKVGTRVCVCTKAPIRA